MYVPWAVLNSARLRVGLTAVLSYPRRLLSQKAGQILTLKRQLQPLSKPLCFVGILFYPVFSSHGGTGWVCIPKANLVQLVGDFPETHAPPAAATNYQSHRNPQKRLHRSFGHRGRGGDYPPLSTDQTLMGTSFSNSTSDGPSRLKVRRLTPR